MGNTSRLELVISTDSTGAVTGIESVGKATKSLESDSQGPIERLKGQWLGVAAAIYGALQTIQTGLDLAEQAAAFQEQRDALAALAGQYQTTAGTIIDALRGATNGLLTMAEAANIASQGLLRGLNPQQLEELARGAEALSNATGEKVPAAFSNLVQAVALGREHVLEASLGIIDLNARFGEQVQKMSEAEKQALRYAIVVERLRGVQQQLGESTLSIADQMDKFRVQMADLQMLVGEGVIRAFLAFYGTLEITSAGLLQLAAGVLTLTSYVGWLTDALRLSSGAYEGWKSMADIAWAGQQEAWENGLAKILQAWNGFEEKKKAFTPLGAMTGGGKPGQAASADKDMREMLAAQWQWAAEEETRIFTEAWNALNGVYVADATQRAALAEQFRVQEIEAQVALVEAQVALWELEAQAEVEFLQRRAEERARVEQQITEESIRWWAQYIEAQQALDEQAAHDAARRNAQAASDRDAAWITTAQVARRSAGAMGNAMLNMYELTGKKSQEWFVAWKAFAIAEAIINTALAVTKALASASPPWNFILAAAVAAAGAAEIAIIASAKPGGGSSVSNVGGGAGYAYTPTAQTGVTSNPVPVEPLVVQLIVYGSIVDHDAFAREIVPAITKAQGDRVR
jgi:hypothetical protein